MRAFSHRRYWIILSSFAVCNRILHESLIWAATAPFDGGTGWVWLFFHFVFFQNQQHFTCLYRIDWLCKQSRIQCISSHLIFGSSTLCFWFPFIYTVFVYTNGLLISTHQRKLFRLFIQNYKAHCPLTLHTTITIQPFHSDNSQNHLTFYTRIFSRPTNISLAIYFCYQKIAWSIWWGEKR